MARWVTLLLVVSTLIVGVAHARVIGVVVGRTSAGAAPVRAELAFVREALDSGAGERMQELFPEGYFFSHALVALAWCDLAVAGHADASAADSQARWALDRVASPAGTAPFTRGLEPTYGIFYAGWSLLVRAGIGAVAQANPGVGTASPGPGRSGNPGDLGADGPEGSSEGSSEGGSEGDDLRVLTAAGDEVAAAVAAALDRGGSPFLPAYPGQAWPVDTVVALAGLRAADGVTGADHSDLVRRWVARARAHADPRTGLLPHRVDPSTGQTLQASRGTSQSVIQRFWPMVDPAGAPRSYQAFREHFLTRELGVVAVREYPHGLDGAGDVDSGPLVRGASASATTVAIGAARANGDRRLASAIADEINVFGLPFSWDGRRRYIGGALPVGDAFVAWARATPLGAERDYPDPRPLWPAWLALPWAAVYACWAVWLRRLAVAARRTPRSGPGPGGKLSLATPAPQL